jgi:hypothetical protein
MKLRLCLLLAAISLAMFATRVESARRPRYGGTLRVEIGAVVNSLDPAAATVNSDEAAARQQIDALLYDQRSPNGTFAGVAGSGVFRIAAWDPGKRVVLDVNDDNRAGRAFVDSIEIQMGRSVADRLLDLELNRVDFAELPPENAREAADRGVRISDSQPEQLLALVFLAGRPATQDTHLRDALAASIDRPAIVNFILQKQGEAAGGLLPQWSSGTAFLFPTAADPVAAKALVSQIGGSPAMVLGYDSGDSLDQAIAERIGVNARDAGLAVTVQGIGSAVPVSSGSTCDARLVRVSMPSPDPRQVLVSFIASFASLAGFEPVPIPAGASREQIYSSERAVVVSHFAIPLVWLPKVYGLSERVRDWKAPTAGGSWPFADIWLDGPTGAAPEKENQ